MAKSNLPVPIPDDVIARLEKLRSEHGLRALTGEESGSGVDRLPSGVYGFTYSPCEDNFPLFDRRDIRAFETYKLRDGTVHLLGFLTSPEAEAFEKSEGERTLHLFAEPKGDATRLVEVPLSRIVDHVEGSQRKGTGLELKVSG